MSMRTLSAILSLILFFCSYSSHSQNITNADFYVSGNTIEIFYSLDDIADIDIFCSTDGGKTFGKPLQKISGDVGSNVMPGDKKAVWHVYAENDILYSENVSFKIKVKESKKTIDIDGYLLEMVKVNGGSFEMGSNDSLNVLNDNMPAHDVTLSDFYIAKYEVTVELFKKFIDETNYQTDADRYGGSYLWGRGYWEITKDLNWKHDVDGRLINEADYNQPVIHVSRNDALAFCVWLKQKTGLPFRLPTEAEWEYAAKGGDESNNYPYAGSHDIYEVAWYRHNSYDVDYNDSTDFGIHAVGTKLPNELGLYDMTGNVMEWCNDIYGNYIGGSQMNPAGEVDGEFYVLRGGSWFDNESKCSINTRVYATPNTRRFNSGFRLAL